MAKTSLEQAVELVTNATEEDRAGNYEEAIALYDRSTQYFIHAIKYEAEGEAQKTTIRNKCNSYLARCEQIKKFLNDKKEAAAAEESTIQGVAVLQLSDSSAAGEDAAAASSSYTTEAVEEILLPLIKTKLLSLVSSAHHEQWTSSLRAAMKPLLCPQSQQLQKFDKIAAAEIAVELNELEKKMPEDLKQPLLQIPFEQLRELLRSDWLKSAAKEIVEATDSSGDLESKSAKSILALKLVICLSVEFPKISPGAHDMALRKQKKTPVEETDWFAKQADLIRRWDNHHQWLAYEHPVYSSPQEYLEKVKAKAEATSDSFEVVEVEEEPQSLDRVQRMKEHLQQRSPCTIEEFVKTKTFEAISRHHTKLFRILPRVVWKNQGDQRKDVKEEREQGEKKNDVKFGVPELIRRTVEDMPEELQLQLKQLGPDQLARVVLLDWVDRIVEEKRNDLDDKELSSNAGKLRDILGLCRVAEMYPEELRRVVKAVLIKGKAEKEKMIAERLNAMNSEDLKYYQDSEPGMSKLHLMMRLQRYMSHRKVDAFLALMLPPPEPFVHPDPTPDLPKWAALIESLGMTEEMRKFISQQLQQLQCSQLHEEIAAMLHAKVRNHTEKGLNDLERSIGSMTCNYLDGKETRVDLISQIAIETGHLWLNHVEEKKESDNVRGNDQESQWKECAPATIAALIFMWAAESIQSAEFLGHRLTELKIRKSAELIDSEEARAFTELRTANMEDATNSKTYLFAWIDEKSSEILRKGHELMTSVLEQHMQPSPEIVQPSNDSVQPVQPSSDEVQSTVEQPA